METQAEYRYFWINSLGEFGEDALTANYKDIRVLDDESSLEPAERELLRLWQALDRALTTTQFRIYVRRDREEDTEPHHSLFIEIDFGCTEDEQAQLEAVSQFCLEFGADPDVVLDWVNPNKCDGPRRHNKREFQIACAIPVHTVDAEALAEHVHSMRDRVDELGLEDYWIGVA